MSFQGIIETVAYAVSRSSQLQDQQAFVDDEKHGQNRSHMPCSCSGSAVATSSPVVKEIRDMIDESAYSHIASWEGFLSRQVVVSAPTTITC